MNLKVLVEHTHNMQPEIELSDDLQCHIWRLYFLNNVLRELLSVTTITTPFSSWLPIACRIHWLRRMYVDYL